ncbi:hypothetical protein P378_18130 [Desulforamulus profundi]|uniref:Uncharacterized protein n=2 Tax=Desulforamulus profundi TaxID=1383067 RepID=A0A2C6L1M8_9FIRM|nr:hypothetical protein P378_18130 [Desulforamulus profundi]
MQNPAKYYRNNVASIDQFLVIYITPVKDI